jgi:PKHD-type hydroxylase
LSVRLKNKYWGFVKAISPQQCQDIIKAASTKIQQQGTITGADQLTTAKLGFRKSKIAWINEQWIYNLLNPFIHRANRNAGWNFQWDWNETSQFTIYGKGGYYEWHIDQTDPIKDKNKNINGKIRKLSLTLQLTDSSQYEGGNLQFRWLGKGAKIKTETVKKVKDLGTIIIFPSFMFHRVTPITKGIRQSLVNWSLGKLFE